MAHKSVTLDCSDAVRVWRAVSALQQAGLLEVHVADVRPLQGESRPAAVEAACLGRLRLAPFCEELPRRLYSATHAVVQHIFSLAAQQEASDASADTIIQGDAGMHAWAWSP